MPVAGSDAFAENDHGDGIIMMMCGKSLPDYLCCIGDNGVTMVMTTVSAQRKSKAAINAGIIMKHQANERCAVGWG